MEILLWFRSAENRTLGSVDRLKQLTDRFIALIEETETIQDSITNNIAVETEVMYPEMGQIHADLVPLAQAFRNCCSVKRNCEFFYKQTQIYTIIMKFFRKMAVTSHKVLLDVQLVSMLVQSIANTAATGAPSVNDGLFWADASFSNVKDMMAAAYRSGNRRTLGAAIAAFYNSIVVTREHVTKVDQEKIVRVRLQAAATCRSLWCQMLLALVRDGGVSASADGSDEALEWAHILACRLVQTEEQDQRTSEVSVAQRVRDGILFKLFALVGPRSDPVSVWDELSSAVVEGSEAAVASVAHVQAVSSAHILHEQVILLNLVRDVLEDSSYFAGRKKEVLNGEEQLHPITTALLSSDSFVEFLISIARCVCLLTFDRSQRLESIAEKNVWLAALPAIIGILGTALGFSVDDGSPCVARLSSRLIQETDILCFTLRCLAAIPFLEGVADTHLEPVHDMKSLFSDPIALHEKRACLNDLLTLIGNILYRNERAQDCFREQHGFALVLPHCATNVHSPMTREWALLCIRNACEGNELSQTFVSTLVPQGSVVLKDEEMVRAGLHVEMDKATNKFKVTQL